MAVPIKPTLVRPTDQAILEQLKKDGFSDEYVETPRRLIVSSKGKSKTGKSAFALTALEPIIYIDIDIGTEGVVGKFQQAGKSVLRYEVRASKYATQDVYKLLWQDLKNKLTVAWSLRSGTVVLDTSTEAHELCRLARLGKLTQVQPHNYTEVNTEWRELLRIAYDSPMNTVFIHKMKAVWTNTVDNNGRTKGVKTNNFELAGFGEMDYLSQINIEHLREDNEESTIFSIHIEDSRHTPGLNGMTIAGMPLAKGEQRVGDPLCNFNMLLDLVHGEQK